MRTLGLYCLLEGIPRPEGQVAALRAGLVWHEPRGGDSTAEEAAIRVVAARALCDWALIRLTNITLLAVQRAQQVQHGEVTNGI